VEIFDAEQFDELVDGLGTPRARAEAILNHLKRTALEKMELDPAHYRDFSKLIEETLTAIEEGRMSELEGLKIAKNLRDQETSGYRQDIPQRLRKLRDAPAYYGIVKETLPDRLPTDVLAEMSAQIEVIIERHKIRDWTQNDDAQNDMRNALDDYLYAIGDSHNILLSDVELDEIVEQVIDIARKRA
jgi:type I restriction enzyme, R subunit